MRWLGYCKAKAYPMKPQRLLRRPLLSALAVTTSLIVTGTLAPDGRLAAAGARPAERQTGDARPGPSGTLTPGTPAEVWVGPAGVRRTTAEIMATKAATDRSGVDIDVTRSRTRREAVSVNAETPPAARLATAPDAPVGRDAVSDLAQTPGAPNTDVVTLAETGTIPPDTMGDVGPAQYLVGVNGRVRTINKATGLADGVMNTTLDAFFEPVRASLPTSYPRVRFDRRSGRWFVLAVTYTLPNRYVLAVSDSGVLTAGTVWTLHFWVNTRTAAGMPANQCLADYPTLGVDEDALYVGVNQFCGPTLATAVTYDSSSAYVIRKAPLLLPAPGSLELAVFDELSLGNGAGPYYPQGVDNFDANTTVGYLIGVDNAVLSRLQVRRITDPGGTPSISANLTINVAVTSPPIDVPHPGGVANLESLDDRLQNAVIRGGRLWTNHHIQVDSAGLGSGTGGRNGIRWYEIENLATTPSIRQSGTVFDAAVSNPASYFYGSVMVSGQGHMALGATVAGATTLVNAAATGRWVSDALGTTNGAPTTYTSNTSFTYNAEAPPNPQQWGEHSYTSLDPSDDMTMWTLQQYVNANDSYALRLVRLMAPPPAGLVALTPSTIAPNQANVSVTVTGSSTGGSGFFDPGASFPNRIAAAFSGSGVVVTNIVVVSPTEVTLTVDTTAAARGARTLTITNPDGQTSSLVAALTVNNTPPVATADLYSTAFNTPLTVAAPGVLANDADANGDALTAMVVDSPAHGSVTLSSNGSFLYTPTTAYVGVDTWTYQASDGVATSGFATVTISVGVNTAPGITAPSVQSLIDGGSGAATAALPFTVSDLEGAPVVVTASSSNAAVVAAGGIVLGGSGNNRTVVVSSAPGSVGGTSIITLTASDGYLATNATFTVSVVPLRGRPQTVVSVVARTALTVSWTAPPFSAEAVTGYLIEAGLSPDTTFGTLALGNVLTFSTTAPSGIYYVRIRALTAGGQSAPSNEVVVATGQAAPPLAPLGLLATVQGTNVAFQWRENPLGTEISQYQLHAGSAPGLSDLGVLPLAAGTTTFATGAPAGTYYVRAVAANPSGAGPASNEAAVTLAAGVCTIPAVPTGLTAVPQAGAVTLRWNAPAAGAIPTGYRLEAGASSGSAGIGILALPVSTVVAGSVPSGTYFVRLAATNACGNSAVSNDISFVVP